MKPDDRMFVEECNVEPEYLEPDGGINVDHMSWEACVKYYRQENPEPILERHYDIPTTGPEPEPVTPVAETSSLYTMPIFWMVIIACIAVVVIMLLMLLNQKRLNKSGDNNDTVVLDFVRPQSTVTAVEVYRPQGGISNDVSNYGTRRGIYIPGRGFDSGN